ncbi:MAG: TIGR01777 family oxidoreductase [Acidobacteriota bacterium]
MTEKQIFITGASGFIGRHLVAMLTSQGAKIVALTRAVHNSQGNIKWVSGKPTAAGEWQQAINDCHAVINLAGEPIIDRRWTATQKQRIRDSRVKTTEQVVAAIKQAAVRPTVLVNASAIGYYAKNEETALDETAAPAKDFLGELCVAWEEAARPVEALGVRLVFLRIGVVLGREGGALAKMLPPFKLGLGGPAGSGTQWVSWIHIDDLVNLIQFAIEHNEIKGPLNGVAPNPVRMKELAQELGRALHRPAIFPVPGFMLQLLMGEGAQVVLDGQRILPKVAEQAGYQFRFANLANALRDLLVHA